MGGGKDVSRQVARALCETGSSSPDMRALRNNAAGQARHLFRKHCLGDDERTRLRQVPATSDCTAPVILA